MSRWWGLGWVALALSTGGVSTASAQVPTVDFEITGAANAAPDQPLVYALNYSVAGNDLSDVAVTWDLPRGLVPVGAGAPTGWSSDCNYDLGSAALGEDQADWTCTWTNPSLSVPAGGLSGQIAVTVMPLKFMFGNGQTESLTASLSASYLDGGTPGTVGPLPSSTDVTIDTTLALQPLFQWEVSIHDYGYTSNPAGVPGILARHYLQISHTGTTRIEPGAVLTTQLPAGAVYVSHEVTIDPAAGSIQATTTPAPWTSGTVEFTLGSSFGAVNAVTRNTEGFASTQNPINQSLAIPVLLFHPCSDVPLATTETIALSFSGDAPGHTTGTEVLLSETVAPHSSLTSASSMFICGTDPSLAIGGSTWSQAGAGAQFAAGSRFDPPAGVVPITDGYFNLRIPDGINLATMSLRFGQVIGAWDDTHGFSLFHCTVPSETGPFDFDAFSATYQATACTQAPSLVPNDPPPAGTTHIVGWAPTWNHVAASGNVVAGPVRMSGTAYSASCTTGGTYVFNGYAEAKSAPGATPMVTTATHDLEILDTALPTFMPSTNPPSATRGATSNLMFTPVNHPSGPPVLNPLLTLSVPAGVTIDNLRFVDAQQPGCLAPTVAVSSTANGPITGPATATLQLGATGNDWYIDTSCSSNGCGIGSAGQVAFDATFAPDHPFFNGEVVSFPFEMLASNAKAGNAQFPNPAVDALNVIMQVPAEMRLDVEPHCDASGNDGMLVTFNNSGGIPLSDVEVVIPIPKTGDGSGTAADTTLNVATSTSLGVHTCSTDGGVNYSAAGCTASATHVKVTVPSLPQFQSGALTLLLDTPAGTAAGTLVSATGTMSSNELLPITTLPSPPMAVAQCPGTLEVDVFWDADADGVWDPAEQGLAGWGVDVTHPVNGQTYALAIPAGGQLAHDLAPADYGFATVEPVTTQGTWASTTTVPTTVTIQTGQVTSVLIGVTCACDDGDSCTVDTCNPDGTCTHAIPPQGCCGDGIVNGNDVCDDGANIDQLDGCTSSCECSEIGWTNNGGSCVPVCGDAILVVGEGCDDGNTVDGDGCDANCQPEANTSCTQPTYTECLPAVFCQTGPPSWCDSTDPNHAWCFYLVPGSPWCNSPPVCSGPEYDACVQDPGQGDCGLRLVQCQFCAAVGPSECAETAETCDGVDNDGDGLTDETDIDGDGTDEEVVGTSCTPTGGGCGAYVCVADAWECVAASTSDVEVCDGIDNDCDGLTDEDDTPGPPELICPAAVTYECDAVPTDFGAGASAVDGCDTLTVTNDSPDAWPLGTTDVTFSATDSDGESASCVTPVTVADTTAPTVTCPPTATLDACAPDLSSIAVTVSDSCDAAPSAAIANPVQVTTGVTDVTWTATDAAGNAGTCTTQVTVPAANGMTLTCQDAQTLTLPADSCSLPATATADLLDGCSLQLNVSAATRDYSVGAHDVTVGVEMGTDTLSCIATITVSDVTAPEVVCNAPSQVAAPTTFTASASDACTADASVSDARCVDTDGAPVEGCEVRTEGAQLVIVALPGTVADGVTVQWNATGTDPSGNSTTVACETAVSTATTTAPSECQPGWTLNEDGQCDLIMASGSGGCSASSTPGGGGEQALWLLVALGILGLRRRRAGVAAVVAAGVVAASTVGAPAHAQQGNVPAQLFEPAPGGTLNYVSAQGADILRHLEWAAGLYLNYAYDPLVLRRMSNDEKVKLIEHQLQVDVVAGIGLGDYFELGISVPVVLYQAPGDSGTTLSPSSLASTVMGDLRIYPKVRFFGPTDQPEGFGLALAAIVGVPTGDKENLQGSGTVSVEPRLIAEYMFSEQWRLAVSLGYLARFGEDQSLYNIDIGNELTYALGFEWQPVPREWAVMLDLKGKVGLDPDITKIDSVERPAELAIAARHWPAANHAITLGLSRGLTNGYGTPAVRAFLGYNYTPQRSWDSDGDGVVDDKDACPKVPEDKDAFEDSDGCPDLDNDKDGVVDTRDTCPLVAEDRDGFEDDDGCPDTDNDGDGLLDDVDPCKNKPEDWEPFELKPGQAVPAGKELNVHVVRGDGCPDKEDFDGDGLLDDVDKCPTAREDFDRFELKPGQPWPVTDPDKRRYVVMDGCPDPDYDGDGLLDPEDFCPLQASAKDKSPKDKPGCPRVSSKDCVITLGKIHFKYDKAKIQERSFPVLDEAVDILNRMHPDIQLVEIGGHTDTDGTAKYNAKLSGRRAKAVLKYLSKKGVKKKRLSSIGFGEYVLKVNPERSKADMAMNRRVEFRILKWKDRQCKNTPGKVLIKNALEARGDKKKRNKRQRRKRRR